MLCGAAIVNNIFTATHDFKACVAHRDRLDQGMVSMNWECGTKHMMPFLGTTIYIQIVEKTQFSSDLLA